MLNANALRREARVAQLVFLARQIKLVVAAVTKMPIAKMENASNTLTAKGTRTYA